MCLIFFCDVLKNWTFVMYFFVLTEIYEVFQTICYILVYSCEPVSQKQELNVIFFVKWQNNTSTFNINLFFKLTQKQISHVEAILDIIFLPSMINDVMNAFYKHKNLFSGTITYFLLFILIEITETEIEMKIVCFPGNKWKIFFHNFWPKT